MAPALDYEAPSTCLRANLQLEIMVMSTSEKVAIIRAYEDTDYAQVVDLFIRINRELASPKMRERFEQYIQTSIDGEMSRLRDIFSRTKRNAFWVVETGDEIIACSGSKAAAMIAQSFDACILTGAIVVSA